MFTTKIVRHAKGPVSALHLVKKDGKSVGLLEKYTNTRTTTNPWKVYLGIGHSSTYLGSQPTQEQALHLLALRLGKQQPQTESIEPLQFRA
jgi:hypothetical protein